MNGLLQRRRLAMLFRLWDPQARGGVSRLALAAVLEFYYRCSSQLQRAPDSRYLPLWCHCKADALPGRRRCTMKQDE